ncbi:MAG: peptidase C39 family protein [Candidatus Poribacteria bacterium]|nr:peptidase C39 family protein [Candidatus Poribacteria bacterium]
MPHFPQEGARSCLPACARMVLGFYGIDTEEVSLSRMLGKTPVGTEMLNIELLENADLGVRVETGILDAEAVRDYLNANVPVIVMLGTGALSYWQSDRPHAVVVVGFDDASIYVNDPKFSDAPKIVAWDEFLAAWDVFDRFGAVIHQDS